MFLNKGVLDPKHPKKFDQVFRATRRVSTEGTPDDAPFMNRHGSEIIIPFSPDSIDQNNKFEVIGKGTKNNVLTTQKTSPIKASRELVMVPGVTQRLVILEKQLIEQKQKLFEKTKKIEALEKEIALLKLGDKNMEIEKLKNMNETLKSQLEEAIKLFKANNISWKPKEPKKSKKSKEGIEKKLPAAPAESFNNNNFVESETTIPSIKNSKATVDPSFRVRTDVSETDNPEPDLNHDTPSFSGKKRRESTTFTNESNILNTSTKDEAIENDHSLTITYYKDGIHIEGFSFFEYQTKEAIKILAEIKEREFPAILKSKYPLGKFLKRVDKLNISFKTSLSPRETRSISPQEERIRQLSPEKIEIPTANKWISLSERTKSIYRINLPNRVRVKELYFPVIQSARSKSPELK